MILYFLYALYRFGCGLSNWSAETFPPTREAHPFFNTMDGIVHSRDERVIRYYNVILFKKEEEAQKYLDWFADRFSEKQGIRWGISIKGQGNIIGTLGFNNFQKDHRANLGYDLQFAYWNRGIITKALNEVVRFGFHIPEINRIETEVMLENIALEKVLLKLGFRDEGVLRDWMYWNGKHYDMKTFSLLKKDYGYETGNEQP